MKPILCLGMHGVAVMALAALAGAQDAKPKPTVEKIEGNIFRPVKLEPTEARTKTLKVADGYEITVFAEGLQAPRMMALAPVSALVTRARGPKVTLMIGALIVAAGYGLNGALMLATSPVRP